MKKRYHVIRRSILVLLVLLIGRIFFIQFVQTESLSEEAAQQKINDYAISRLRGEILDRNAIPFTDRDKSYLVIIDTLIINKMDFENAHTQLEEKSEISNIIIYKTNKETAEKIENEGKPGVNVIVGLERYSISTLAKHVLGYLNTNDLTGEAGIEKKFNDVLATNNLISIGVITDLRKKAINASDYRVFESDTSSQAFNIKTTLDYQFQKIVEETMDETEDIGAVVIEDICTGEILAMCSRPDYDANNVGKYLDSKNQELLNKAVASYDAGSVFKIVVSAAALEKNVELSDYNCQGSIQIGDRSFRCHTYETGGHGLLNFETAFAVSCNPYFINLGIKTGMPAIIDMAKAFGIGTTTQLSWQGISETSGNLPDIQMDFFEGDIANWSIGQGGVMITPVQAAHLAAVIANGGINNSVNIIKSIENRNGECVRRIADYSGVRIMSKNTADKIKELMRLVVTEGTARGCNLEDYGGAAGKTGSAQTGMLQDGQEVVQAWFTGFFPYETPEYAMSVFVEDGKSGAASAVPLFEKIARKIMERK